MKRAYWVYIMASLSNVIYVGVTNDLHKRVFEHKNKVIKGFTAKYNISRLVYYQEFDSATKAIAGEKTIKGWTRRKKMDLIKSLNPKFEDLSQTS